MNYVEYSFVVLLPYSQPRNPEKLFSDIILRTKNTLFVQPWVPRVDPENSERGGQDTCQVKTYYVKTTENITEKGRPPSSWPHSQTGLINFIKKINK